MIRTIRTWRVAAAATAAGLMLAACGTTEDSSGDDSGDSAGGEPACDLKIAFMGALTGPAAGLGIAAVNGAELAVEQYNEENPDCPVEFVKQDSQSDPEQAPGVAKDIIDDEKVIGLVGPLFSGESEAADPLFDEAGLPMITASATKPDLADQGWEYWHRLLGNDAAQGPEVSTVITEIAKSERPFLVEDDSAYGQGLAEEARNDLGDAVAGEDRVTTGQTDFQPTVTKVLDAEADSVFFSGYYPEAQVFIKQLRGAGFEGTFVVPDGVKDPSYIDVAGDAAEGTLVTCPCIPGETIGEFNDAYTEMFNEKPGTYGPEAYDAANIFLDGIAEGITDRAEMNEFVTNYDEEGISKHISFDEKGEVEEIPIWSYEVKNGEFVPVKQLA
jgi:branched-chain amino acid transport system substrate-binding protein